MKSWREANLILPNRSSVGLGALLLAMWYAGASQNNGAAYLLCFVVASLGLLSIPHAWANLRGVRLRAGALQPVFAGEPLTVALVAEGTSGRRHYAVQAQAVRGGSSALFSAIPPDVPAHAEIRIPTTTRGIHTVLEIKVSSTFPLGFFSARRTVELRQRFVIYPKPEGHLPLPITSSPASGVPQGARSEGDDYAGVRAWIPGESMRQIDWKAVSRGLPLMTKQWTSEAGHRLVFDFDSIPLADTEAKLSQLARWIVDAEGSGYAYGLQLRGQSFEPALGRGHYHRCLQALAGFESIKSAERDGTV